MNQETRTQIREKVLVREQLRNLSRVERLRRAPLRTIPYYILAALGHIHPFPLTFKTLWGTRMRCYLPEGNTFLYYGYAEANLTNFFLRYVTEGMTVLDVGAHVGFYSMLASALVGTQGRVYSFEPTPYTFKLLTQNTAHLQNVTLINRAITETEQVVSFADYGPGYSAYNTGSAHGAPALKRKATTVQVSGVPLDIFCAEYDVSPDLIKIDAEGFEYQVLRSMQHMLARTDNRPILTIEVAGDSDWAESRRVSFELLRNASYDIYEITVDGSLRPHIEKESYTYDNLVCIPKERVGERADLFAS